MIETEKAECKGINNFYEIIRVAREIQEVNKALAKYGQVYTDA